MPFGKFCYHHRERPKNTVTGLYPISGYKQAIQFLNSEKRQKELSRITEDGTASYETITLAEPLSYTSKVSIAI